MRDRIEQPKVCQTCISWAVPLLTSLSLPLVAFGTWSRRVRFKSSDPTADSSLVILTTEVSDEGEYFCRISTFPTGNFDREMSLTVWSESYKKSHGMSHRDDNFFHK